MFPFDQRNAHSWDDRFPRCRSSSLLDQQHIRRRRRLILKSNVAGQRSRQLCCPSEGRLFRCEPTGGLFPVSQSKLDGRLIGCRLPLRTRRLDVPAAHRMATSYKHAEADVEEECSPCSSQVASKQEAGDESQQAPAHRGEGGGQTDGRQEIRRWRTSSLKAFTRWIQAFLLNTSVFTPCKHHNVKKPHLYQIKVSQSRWWLWNGCHILHNNISNNNNNNGK